jgi:hypothetical protein
MSKINPYEIILDEIIKDMSKFGIVSSIAISSDIYNIMTKKEIDHIESFMNSNIKWLISNEKKGYYKFLYSYKPVEFYDDV